MELIPCIYSLRPDVTWKNDTVNGYDLESIAKTYESSQPIPTIKECEDEWESIKGSGALKEEAIAIHSLLKNSLAWQFRMILELFEVGKSKGVWVNTDFSSEVKQKAGDWKSSLERLSDIE